MNRIRVSTCVYMYIILIDWENKTEKSDDQQKKGSYVLFNVQRVYIYVCVRESLCVCLCTYVWVCIFGSYHSKS